jgi:hypothetical protein
MTRLRAAWLLCAPALALAGALLLGAAHERPVRRAPAPRSQGFCPMRADGAGMCQIAFAPPGPGETAHP